MQCALDAAANGRALGDVLDPTCGSGAFLSAAALRGGVPHGVEIDVRVMLLGYANVLLAAGRPPRIVRDDFLRAPLPGPDARAPADPARQYDTVISNPPFGVKGVAYEDVVRDCATPEAFPLKSGATGLFLQRIVRSVRVGGRGVVVLPLGKELASAGASEVRLRQALLRAVIVREVIEVPAGAFTNTPIRTAVVVFDKVRELGECVAKKGKGVGVRLDVPLATTAVVFRQPVGEPVTADAARLEAAAWSLAPDAYRTLAPAAADTPPQENACPTAAVGDVFVIKNGTSLTRSALVAGAYPVIGGGKSPIGMHNAFNADAHTVLVSCTGSCGWVSRYDTPVFMNADCAALLPGAQVDGNYAYHVLRDRMPAIQQMRTGMAQPHLNKGKLRLLRIPLPPLERQREIAAALDAAIADAGRLEATAALIEAQMVAFLRRHTAGVDCVPVATLAQIQTGTYITKKAPAGEYPVYGGGGEAFLTDSFNREDKTVIAKDGVSPCCVRRVPGKFFLNHHGWTLEPGAAIDGRFLDHVLLLDRQPAIYGMAAGAAQKGITQERFGTLPIPLPPLESQRLVAAELDEMQGSVTVLRKLAERARRDLPRILRDCLGDAAVPDAGQEEGEPAGAAPDEDGEGLGDAVSNPHLADPGEGTSGTNDAD